MGTSARCYGSDVAAVAVPLPIPQQFYGVLSMPLLPQHFSTDPVAASIMKIHTFNRDRDRVKLGVDTIAK